MVPSWKGIYPALTTKFKSNDTLDLPLFRHNLHRQMLAGVDGIVLGGTLGEASTLTANEKEQLVKTALEVSSGRIPVILNIAEGSTREAVKQAELAKKWGADGLMLLPPMRYKADHRETVAFFKTITAAAGLPVMIYNNPVDYKTEVTLDIFAELAEEPLIQAVKESTRDVSNVTRMINRFNNRFSILCGVDTLALESLQMGAHGWVAGLCCAFPEETVSIYRFFRAGHRKEMLAIYRWFLPLLELDLHPKLVQYIKLAESEAGLGSEFVRPPRLMLDPAERRDILAIIHRSMNVRPEVPEYLHL